MKNTLKRLASGSIVAALTVVLSTGALYTNAEGSYEYAKPEIHMAKNIITEKKTNAIDANAKNAKNVRQKEMEEAKRKEEEKLRQAAEKAAAEAAKKSNSSQSARASSSGSGSSSSQQSDNIWHITYYYNDQNATSAPSDGSLNQWRSGYFIAHSNTANGKRILNLGQGNKVEVNGRVYQYVCSKTVSRDTTWEAVAGFATANGGIAFQTCVSNGYIIKHCEPL